ncbi:Alpha/Beta hydrolase protein [Pelagophyceae sp. CCMP2097]|nr:Alpha/Beta hydrolase protein [Pelagophyceae sp. CCMP2097]|mmetsp:Transcript_32653/g.113012  ORF Transcript_32653/g.113012 Transcript_32653/m.113012 type:complete len:354 (-) Transcript_32653:131-1192(-)
MSQFHKKYGKWINVDPASNVDARYVKLRVLCIPQAGMGAWAYHGWQSKLPNTVELLPVELPGRNARIQEPKLESMAECVSGLLEGVSGLLAEKPFVVLGHSLGALMAFELCVALEKGGLGPLCLIVSGSRPPQFAAPRHDQDLETPAMAKLSSPRFWDAFERRYGANPDLQSSGIRNFIEPLLRADFGLLETYAPSRTPADGPLKWPLVACCATGDNRVAPEQMRAWGDFADKGPGGFEQHWFDPKPKMLPWSTPHRYLVEGPDQFINFLAEKCAQLIAEPAADFANGAYVVSAKRGALLREGIGMDSPQVDILHSGANVTVVEVASPTDPKTRVRIDAPVSGWLSAHMLRKP